MKDHMSWVTSWEAWRQTMGHQGSTQRSNVLRYLEAHPCILYWGDSWFSTPLYLNLARQSARRIQGLGMILGKPGAEADELFSASEVERIGKRIKNNPFDLICLSAGGNDCLSEHLATCFLDWNQPNATKPKKLSAQQAYQHFRNGPALGNVTRAYERVLDNLQALQRIRPHLRAIGHPYIPIERIGQPAALTPDNIGLIAWVKDEVGPWLWTHMQHVLEGKDQGREFARLMLEDGFRDTVLRPLRIQYSGLFEIVDFGNLDQWSEPHFWNDEIHPSEQGFARLAIKFNAAVRACLPVAKQSAVSS